MGAARKGEVTKSGTVARFPAEAEAWPRLREGTGGDGRGREGTRATRQAAALPGPRPGSPTPARPGGGSGRCARTQRHYLGPAAAAETRASCPCPAAQTVRRRSPPRGAETAVAPFPWELQTLQGRGPLCSPHPTPPHPGRGTVPVAGSRELERSVGAAQTSRAAVSPNRVS